MNADGSIENLPLTTSIVPLFVNVPATLIVPPLTFIVPFAVTRKFCVHSNVELAFTFITPIAS